MELNQAACGAAGKQELRIVLAGITGSGKSHTGNTLLRMTAFHTDYSTESVTSVCQKETAEFEGQSLAVIDTPGVFDTNLTQEQVIREIARCVSFAAPGPHVFLVVNQPNRFKRDEGETLKIIKQLFGEAAAQYTIALFTHGDDLEYHGRSLEELINRNRELASFVHQCGGGYHVLNNRNREPQQVRELLNKINRMVSRNRGTYYTNEMLQEAETAIREEIEKLRRENKELRYAEARRQAEKENSFIQRILHTVGTFLREAAVPLGAAAGQIIASLAQRSCSIQ